MGSFIIREKKDSVKLIQFQTRFQRIRRLG